MIRHDCLHLPEYQALAVAAETQQMTAPATEVTTEDLLHLLNAAPTETEATNRP